MGQALGRAAGVASAPDTAPPRVRPPAARRASASRVFNLLQDTWCNYVLIHADARTEPDRGPESSASAPASAIGGCAIEGSIAWPGLRGSLGPDSASIGDSPEHVRTAQRILERAFGHINGGGEIPFTLVVVRGPGDCDGADRIADMIGDAVWCASNQAPHIGAATQFQHGRLRLTAVLVADVAEFRQQFPFATTDEPCDLMTPAEEGGLLRLYPSQLFSLQQLSPCDLCPPPFVAGGDEDDVVHQHSTGAHLGRVFLSSWALAADIQVARALGITHVVNCTPDHPNLYPAKQTEDSVEETMRSTYFAQQKGLQRDESASGAGAAHAIRLHYHRVPVVDVAEHSALLLAHLPAAVAFIDDAVAGGGRVLIHCRHGQSRSAAVAAAWLASGRLAAPRAFRGDITEALSHCKACRPRVYSAEANKFRSVLELFVHSANDSRVADV
eukprot:SAG31_NODE_3960_length_3717_cov_10.714483_3_plen_443_part_00